MAFLNSPSNMYFNMFDGGNTYNPVTGSVVTTNQWVHVVVSYDFRADNFYMFYNGQLVYSVNGVRYVYCQTSGSVSIGRDAVRPVTMGNSPAPFTGALSCAQLYSSPMQSAAHVARTQRFCSHPDFVGCFPLQPTAPSTDFIFNPGNWDDQTVNVYTCRENCGAAGYRFAGLRDGNICLCGNSYGSDGPETPEACNMLCNNTNTDWCGGANAFSVYRSSLTRAVMAPSFRSIDYASKFFI